jgi:TetR/AcrR family transcriptional regulator, transcriptional repressor for nem operon
MADEKKLAKVRRREGARSEVGTSGAAPVGKKRGRKERNTREKILNAAIHLFWAKGFGETSLSDVVEAAEVNPGSFYYFYKSKENLLIAVLERYKELLHTVLLAPVYERFSDPIERVFGLLAGYREAIVATGCTYGCPIGRLSLEIAPEYRRAHALLAQNFTGWTDEVKKNLAAASERFPKATDFERLAHFVLTVMEGGVMQSRSYRNVKPFDQAVDELRSHFEQLFAVARAEQGNW